MKNASVHLVLAGDGDKMAEYQQLAAELGISERTHFIGKIDHDKLPEIYARADIVVLPSQIQESFGMVLIEAMACGKPVIASNIPGVRTVVEEGVDGFLVDPGSEEDLAQKLEKMLALPEPVRQSMGKAGRCKVEQKYTWELVGARLEQIYLETLQNSPVKALPRQVGGR